MLRSVGDAPRSGTMEGKMKKTRLMRTRQPAYRYVLFSYGGKAAKRRSSEEAWFNFPFFRSKETEIKDDMEKNETEKSEKIIDYATLLSWYNENKLKTSAVNDRKEASEIIKKQRELKFLLL